jgi:hypothetical protein
MVKSWIVRHPAAATLLRCIYLHKVSPFFFRYATSTYIVMEWLEHQSNYTTLSIKEITQLLSKLNLTKTQKQILIDQPDISIWERKNMFSNYPQLTRQAGSLFCASQWENLILVLCVCVIGCLDTCSNPRAPILNSTVQSQLLVLILKTLVVIVPPSFVLLAPEWVSECACFDISLSIRLRACLVSSD